MKMTLEQEDIETALRAYLQANYGLSLRNKVAVMDFTAGRGKNGLTVLVTVKDAGIPGEDDVGTASVATLIENTKQEKSLSATDKRIAAQADAAPGTVGALLNTAEAEAKPKEVEAAVVVVTEQQTEPAPAPVVVETPVEVEAAPVAEAEVPAVSTEEAVAEEAKPATAPKTSSGLFS